MTNTLAKIRNFIIDDILKGNDLDITDDLNLGESGILSSLATMRLVSFVEDEFDIVVGVSDPRTRFTTIREIAHYVIEKTVVEKNVIEKSSEAGKQ
ncbi:acyl carrier protein [Xenorhabdus eapokensis]|uniref:Acyl carrier protein n=1 Tax=Xenorhabdus eapokensis TaxID=1873482 RepID=A0A1Q5TTE1_9GAMM|nr:acyl carrier protein [Xenorhabdus eapokensis]OKP03473.1 acyl carrier protein [Xenorhabdus eapokensis]